MLWECAAQVASLGFAGRTGSGVNRNGSRKDPKNAREIKLFTGNANPQLAAEIADHLGVPIGKATVTRFEDGEVNVMVHENVRGKDVYIVQPTCSPVNENLMELMLMVSTMRRASARRITAVIPYYGYARQDRKMTARVPISASARSQLRAVCSDAAAEPGISRVQPLPEGRAVTVSACSRRQARL